MDAQTDTITIRRMTIINHNQTHINTSMTRREARENAYIVASIRKHSKKNLIHTR